MTNEAALSVENLRHTYGERTALDGLSFEVTRGEVFALLGPNGGGKTTLFRILTTLMRPSGGSARIFGIPVTERPAEVRRQIGVVFQQPSLDPKLSVRENMIHHGHIYGMHGRYLREEATIQLNRFGLTSRADDIAETLSGGLQRRVELAKALLPNPDMLFLDEPSTGLDPGARLDFGAELQRLRAEQGATIVLTTHIMEEADRCDRVAIIHEGHLVALGKPDELKHRLGGEVISIEANNAEALRQRVQERFGWEGQVVDSTLRIELPGAHALVPQLLEAFASEVKTLTLGQPTLEDVFVHETGRRFSETSEKETSK